MPPQDDTPGNSTDNIEKEIWQLRVSWMNRSHADTVVELEKKVREIRGLEAQVAASRRKVDDRDREFQRLRDIERLYRAVSGERQFCNELSDVNANLRRIVTQRGPDHLDETVMQRLHAELRDKDSAIDTLSEEVDQLRRLQRELLSASGEGQTGELLAANHHIAFLSQQRDELVGRNSQLQDDMVRVHGERLNQKRGAGAHSVSRLDHSAGSLTRDLCIHCKPKTAVWQGRMEDEKVMLQREVEKAYAHIDGLTEILNGQGVPVASQRQLRAPPRPSGILGSAGIVTPSGRSHPPTSRDSQIHLGLHPVSPQRQRLQG